MPVIKDNGNQDARIGQLLLKFQAVDAGSRTSNTRQLGPSDAAAQEILRLAKDSDRKPTDFSRPWMAARTPNRHR